MLSDRWGHGDTVIAARSWGLIKRTWGARGWGENRREGGVAGYTCEGRMVGRLGGTRRAGVREREVTVGQVVVLVVGQERCRVVVVVVVIMEGRT